MLLRGGLGLPFVPGLGDLGLAVAQRGVDQPPVGVVGGRCLADPGAAQAAFEDRTGDHHVSADAGLAQRIARQCRGTDIRPRPQVDPRHQVGPGRVVFGARNPLAGIGRDHDRVLRLGQGIGLFERGHRHRQWIGLRERAGRRTNHAKELGFAVGGGAACAKDLRLTEFIAGYDLVGVGRG